jgi:hypothetical protein
MVNLRKGVNLSGMLLRYYRFGEKPPKPRNQFLRELKSLYSKLTMTKVDFLMQKASLDARDDFYKIIK